jgi:hypothetical protein
LSIGRQGAKQESTLTSGKNGNPASHLPEFFLRSSPILFGFSLHSTASTLWNRLGTHI